MENNYIGNSRTESIMCDIKPQFYNLISSLVELKSLDVFKNTGFKPLFSSVWIYGDTI